MKLHQAHTAEINIIKSSASNQITINDAVYSRSLIVSRNKILEHWRHSPLSSLDKSDFDVALELDPELVILGTGQTLIFPDQRMIWEFQSQGMGFEVMDTAAACRTYNILAAEDRNVVAALIL